MKTIFAVWHQAEGVVTTHLFEEPPTEEQMHALRVALELRHRRPDMDMRVRPVLLLGPDELPDFPARDEGPSEGSAAVDVFRVAGEGVIE